MAKVDNSKPDIIEGRHWGNSYNLPIKCKRIVEYGDLQAKYIIEKIRYWLLKKGKKIQADPEYLNFFTEQTILLDESQFKEIEEIYLPPGVKIPNYYLTHEYI